MPNGMTPEQMLERLFTETVGMDGQGGIKADVKEIKNSGIDGRRKINKKIDHIEKKMVTTDECERHRSEPIKKRADVLKIRALEAAIAGTVISAVLAVLKGIGWL